jgi:cephalosporin-C deacetylase-like acetyl esterase
LILYGVVVTSGAALTDDLTVLGGKNDSLLHDYMMKHVDSQYEARREALDAAIESSETILQRQKRLRDDFRKMIGPLPEKTSLNAKVVGAVNCDGYRIERVIYESRPGHHVTANLYLPTKGRPPFPGVLVPCGHSDNGKAAEVYQSVSILLAKNGLVAFIFDPIGQGERLQLLDAPRNGTTTHTLLGLGALLVGVNTGNYRLWDGIRSLDYLASRPEVDPKRLGCTGNSGGGTMTTWLMAADDRIGVAAPSCFVTSLERLLAVRPPPDAEQLWPRQGARGIEHTDFITMRAPKPTRILAAERDFFPFDGTQEAYREAADVYNVLGHPERVDLFSYDDDHGFSRPRRQAAVQWMRRWFLDDSREIVEPEHTLQQDADLQVTRAGQVVREYVDEVTIQSLNLQRARRLAASREAFWTAKDKEACLAEVRRLIGFRPNLAEVSVATKGVVQREGYRIEKLVIHREDELPIPALLFVPDKRPARLPATLYVDGTGKAVDAQPDGPIETLVRQQRIILSIDVRGYGETADDLEKSPGKFFNVEFRTAVLAIHIGRPLLGQRAEDVAAALDILTARDDVDRGQIELVGVDRAGPVALHAAALDPRFAGVVVRSEIRSWIDDVVAKPLQPDLFGHVVPGALEKYDLPDLERVIAPRPVRIE